MPDTEAPSEQLAAVLAAWADGDARRDAVARTIGALSQAAVAVGRQLELAPLTGGLDETLAINASGDRQKRIDLAAHNLVLRSLEHAPVAAMASEEHDGSIALLADAPLVVAVDPLDGSGNIAINGPMGMIFSIRPSAGGAPDDEFLRPGSEQLAAGFFLYGPATMLVISTGSGTDVYSWRPEDGVFVRSNQAIRVPKGTPAYAINASNARHWTPEFRTYVADLQAGAEGLRGQDFNMRWYGALVIEALRILYRGGIYLYPADARPDRKSGSLRLLYEAHPIAFLMEQAGGAATDGHDRILDKAASSLHQRTPLFFGSADKVERVGRYLKSTSLDAERAPLFTARGLLRD
ncbi:MAG: class 1 fructose-bisphosphatase [Acidimicrobiales bacterium]